MSYPLNHDGSSSNNEKEICYDLLVDDLVIFLRGADHT